MHAQHEPQKIQQRVIRVFISSTFRDMKEEREILVKRVFPKLRKICEERQVTWGEVDLRWGVTEEQKAEGEVLPICLEEIKRCRPYFVGLLGERYGWIPDAIPQDLIDRESWLKEHLSHSVTELEILHGVLNNPDMAAHAFFYFRDPQYIKNLPEDAEPTDFASEDESSKAKLGDLKERIRKSGFHVCENYANPKALEALVLEDLTRVISTRYPPDDKISPLDRDALDHEAFAQSRSQVYIGRDEYFNSLDKHILSNEPPLVILGESGSGKSALLANWALKYKEEHPDELLIMHFIGASPYSTGWAAILRRIMGELKRHFDIQEEIREKPDELRVAFANWLHMASARGKVILILDALNQIEDRDGAPDLVWLPPVIPENVRMILSTLPDRPLDDLKKRNWPTLTVKALTPEERKLFIGKYLSQYAKALSDPRTEKIANARPSENPLYIKLLLEELRLFGEHEELDERIEHYLEAQNPYELYTKVLARWEKDYEEGNDLVGGSMTLIWASRRGLTESELLDMLGRDGEPLPRAQWSPLFLIARESFISRSGLLNFSHDFLRNAVHDRYISSDERHRKLHTRLANYFKKQDPNPRMIDELPWQLVQGHAWQKLRDLLTDPSFFVPSFVFNQFDVKAYWVALERAGISMMEAYKPVINSPMDFPDIDYAWHIDKLLAETGHTHEAFSLQQFFITYYRNKGDTDRLPSALGNQALILQIWGHLDEAMALHKEQEFICRALGNNYRLQGSLGNQARILHIRGQLDEAMNLYKESALICRELRNKDNLSASLCGQASILQNWGRLGEATTLYKEQERICREMGNKDSLSFSLGGQASILYARGQLDEAMNLYKESALICRELGNKGSLSYFIGYQAAILYAREQLDESMVLCKEQERICRDMENKDGLSISLCRQALILEAWGRLDEAMALHKEAERLSRELGNKESLSFSLGGQARILHIQGHLDEAMSLYKEQERIYTDLGSKIGLYDSFGGQAQILHSWGKLDEAMTLYKEQEHICRELGNKNGLPFSLSNQATILDIRGLFNEAVALHKEVERICKEIGNKHMIVISLINRANFMADKMGKPKEALPLAEEAYNLAIENGLEVLSEQIKPTLDAVRKKALSSGKE